MMGIELIGWIGFGILIAAWIIQTSKTIKRGNTDMNILFILMYFSSSVLLLIYSILIEDPVFTTLNIFLTLGSGINLYYKIKPRNVV